jgi:hypothetical protein
MSGMEPAAGWTEDSDDRPPTHVLDRPPGWLFHLALVPAALWLLHAFSFPGFDFLGALLAVGLLGLAALAWALRVATYLWARRKGAAEGSWRWLVIAPLGGLLVIGMAWARLPLRARWELAKADFERAARQAPPVTDADEWVAFDVPGRIGSYRVIQSYRVGDAVIFYDSKGSLFDDAGFAYLPSGPFDELSTGWLDAPQFWSLGDGWYTWTASW